SHLGTGRGLGTRFNPSGGGGKQRLERDRLGHAQGRGTRGAAASEELGDAASDGGGQLHFKLPT
ncbi:unnamed protein product, partial [Urochloa humidicola]